MFKKIIAVLLCLSLISSLPLLQIYASSTDSTDEGVITLPSYDFLDLPDKLSEFNYIILPNFIDIEKVKRGDLTIVIDTFELYKITGRFSGLRFDLTNIGDENIFEENSKNFVRERKNYKGGYTKETTEFFAEAYSYSEKYDPSQYGESYNEEFNVISYTTSPFYGNNYDIGSTVYITYIYFYAYGYSYSLRIEGTTPFDELWQNFGVTVFLLAVESTVVSIENLESFLMGAGEFFLDIFDAKAFNTSFYPDNNYYDENQTVALSTTPAPHYVYKIIGGPVTSYQSLMDETYKYLSTEMDPALLSEINSRYFNTYYASVNGDLYVNIDVAYNGSMLGTDASKIDRYEIQDDGTIKVYLKSFGSAKEWGHDEDKYSECAIVLENTPDGFRIKELIPSENRIDPDPMGILSYTFCTESDYNRIVQKYKS
jgi:hypothetical protein